MKEIKHIRKIDNKVKEIGLLNMNDDDMTKAVNKMSDEEILDALKRLDELTELLNLDNEISDSEMEEKMKKIHKSYGLSQEDIDNMSVEDVYNFMKTKSN